MFLSWRMKRTEDKIMSLKSELDQLYKTTCNKTKNDLLIQTIRGDIARNTLKLLKLRGEFAKQKNSPKNVCEREKTTFCCPNCGCIDATILHTDEDNGPGAYIKCDDCDYSRKVIDPMIYVTTHKKLG